MTPSHRVLLIVSGGIAAYKSLDLIRLLRRAGCEITPVLTKGGAQFVTPLALGALAEAQVYDDLWALTDARTMGHIALSRAADLVVVAPASADLLARMATGLCDDLATTLLLATDKPVLAAPAMNVRMWEHPATRANLATLAARGVQVVGPEIGAMACGEWGEGRLAEPETLCAAILARLRFQDFSLTGKHAIVTSGPTHEPIDPVRYLGNRSSGKQGHAIAAALAARGARVTLVSGPVVIPDPPDVTMVRVETARQMLAACEAALPAEIAVCVAAVADWGMAEPCPHKLKKQDGAAPPALTLVSNPDILARLARPAADRPALVVGFAAETEALLPAACDKLRRKQCDWLLANKVGDDQKVFGAEDNEVYLLTTSGAAESWPRTSKQAIADRLADRVAAFFHPAGLSREIA